MGGRRHEDSWRDAHSYGGVSGNVWSFYCGCGNDRGDPVTTLAPIHDHLATLAIRIPAPDDDVASAEIGAAADDAVTAAGIGTTTTGDALAVTAGVQLPATRDALAPRGIRRAASGNVFTPARIGPPAPGYAAAGESASDLTVMTAVGRLIDAESR